MHTNHFRNSIRRIPVLAGVLLFGAVAAFGQQQINLTAGPTTTTLPDGTTVPMWGYFCGAPTSGSTATCAALNPVSLATATTPATWSPVVITIPTGTSTAPASLTINLTNSLSFTPTGSTTANTVPTSIVIVGQVGGGLGGAPTTTTSPSHTNAQGCATWFIASSATPPGVPCPAPQAGASNMPPTQAQGRVQSMATEVAAGATTALTWANLKPGTYLLESGTHPSIQVPMGLIGVLVVTTAPSGTTAGAAYPAVGTSPAVPYNAELPLVFSEIDPVQNKAVNAAVNTAGFSETKVWSGMTGQCGNASSPVGVVNTCYPPAVNYTPFYYLINGVAFNKTNAAVSMFPATAGVAGTPPTPVVSGIAGTVLVRLVNAGLRLHVPSIVNSQTQGFNGAGAAATVAGFTLIAEDGNVLPNVAPPGATTVPAAPRVQTDVLMVPSKVYDALINVPASGAPALPIYDRELSLSGNSSLRDAGMLAYIGVNGAALPAVGSGLFAPAVARADTYNGLAAGKTFSVTDTSKGVIANDTNVYGVVLLTAPTGGTLTCNAQPQNTVPGICANGTFTYTPTGTATSDSFTYCANGTVTGTTCSSGITATVTLGASTLAGNPTAITQAYTAKTSTYLKMPSPGLLAGNSDPNNLPISLVTTGSLPAGVMLDANGGFNVLNPTPSSTAATTLTFSYTVQNSQGRTATGSATVTFPTPSNLQVNVLDAQLYNNCNGNTTCISGLTPIGDYRWIIEEDKTFWVDPNCTTNTSATTPGCPAIVGPAGQSTVPTFGVNFHVSNMDYVAQGCTGPLSCEGGQTVYNPATGTHIPAVCDVGNGACRADTTGNGFTAVLPSSVHLDPAKRYYISVLPGDAGNPFPAYVGQPVCSSTGGTSTSGQCGHTMGGAPVPPACNVLGGTNACTTSSAFAPVTVTVLPTPLPTGKLSVIVFEDDFPLNGEQDGGGGNGTVAPIEPGLGGFNIVLWDTFGGLGDVTGQNTYDMFNQPLSNALAGQLDPSTGFDACPISPQATANSTQQGITGMIVTCPKYESDNATLSPLAGQAIIANLMPEKFSVQAYPAADRIARGEEWLQTNTLDGQHPHDSFIRIGEPSYFQEYGPAGYHVSIGFANPAIINARHNDVCAGAGSPGAVGPCTNTITGQVDVQRQSRTPDQRLYPSGSRDGFAWTQCWVSLGDPDGEDFMFVKCDASGNFKFTSVPSGNWRLTIGDQWNDQIIDGLSTPANVGCTSYSAAGNTGCSGGQTLNMGNIGVQQWQANLYTRVFVDDNKNGIWDPGEIGIPFLYTRIYYRDGHNANGLNTDFNGIANFNETFPLFNWYVVEADSTRYKTTGTHTVYDAGGPADGSPSCGNGTTARQCGTSPSYKFLSNTFEALPLPADLSVPGAVYCAKADCTPEANSDFTKGTAVPSSTTASTGRIDPPWVWAEGWAGLTTQSNWIDFGKAPYAACPPACATVTTTAPGSTTATTTQVGENGGIQGQVTYASTRPFDSAEQMILQPWEPLVPGVTINLYQEGFAVDGVTPTLTMVDTTTTSSWDAWAQGFYPGSTATPGTGQTSAQKPYMNCPGQGTNTGTNADLFYFTLFDQPNFLDYYNSLHNGGMLHTLPYNSQYKCYDAMHVGNQIQPAPYDGRYFFPSSLGINATTGKPLTTLGSTNGVTSNMPGTNCTVCVANPDTTDVFRVGTPMLPPGKYVVEVTMPPGYEVYKEEDKNLLIGDNFIAPTTQQFGGLGTDIFIIPDQASVASLYDPNASGFNPNNYQNQTLNLNLQGGQLSGVPGYPGYQDPVWPCVGEMRVVPDYLSLFPKVQEVAPFAGATRPLCDRKEVTLVNQDSVRIHFAIYTSTHIAAKYAGVITDDFTSEFDPFSPQFGEKFAPPNLPISTKDYLGNEISRVYSDHWGTYNGLTYSSWEVNPPNITGYSPTMMTQCMNDPGPVMDTNPSSPTFGQMITDPLYNPAYSDFCYEEPYMPGLTNYTDTPVVPTQAFVGAAYNSPDCAYPDATPAIKEVDGDGVGPWVSAAGHTLTITALGDQQVTNEAFAGPSASVAPFNQKTIKRHYGFGATAGTVTIGGVPLTGVTWSDTTITGTVPTGVANCAVQQQAQYGGSLAQCGQLMITASTGQQSVDSVTVTIGGKMPTHVSASQTIQSAIDAAAPGDLIIVDPTCPATCTTDAVTTTNGVTTTSNQVASHTEMLIMWKPVRLQGVGAASSIINANVHPAGKLLDPWRRHVNCLFGLTLQGVPMVGTGTGGATPPYDPTGTYSCPDAQILGDTWKYFTTPGSLNVPQIDRLPLEAVVGWNATVNGNLAEQLQEPSLMGAYEGAGITVLAKGVWTSPGENIWTDTTEGGAFPSDALLLQDVPVKMDDEGGALGPQYSYCWVINPGVGSTTTELVPNPYPSNFICNPSSIDGLSITNSSQGGGGIFVHGWAHNLQLANNRVYNNAGTLSGGITVGQGEFPIAITIVVQEGTSGPTAPTGEFDADNPPSCGYSTVLGTHLPYCLDLNVNVHNNYITNNSSIGDELFSGTLSGGGGATICTGSDYYKFQYNWVCGNLSSGEGGGVVHLGFIYNGDIEHNTIALNQSTNPTIPTNGGGIQVMGTPDTDPVCGAQIDQDCPPGLSDGTGPNLVINANLIQGNMAESGSGGGIRLQQVNGTDVATFPNPSVGPPSASGTFSCPFVSGTSGPRTACLWNSASITNNIIVNNLAGWDGAGISLQDSLNVSIINNTIAHNDSLASSGVLTQSIGTPEASGPPGNCTMTGPTGANSASCPQSAGVTSTLNSSVLTTTFTGLTITCPTGQPNCTKFSNPLLGNNIIWQNRSFHVGITGPGTGTLNQQNLVGLFNAVSNSAVPVQTFTGACQTQTGVTYWDLGVRGDTGPTNHGSGFTLGPTYSVLTSTTGYGSSNSTSNPNFVSEYCDGSRVPPECTVADGCAGPHGFGVPPGIADSVTPNPQFSLVPSATVDEGNNWINVSWGPLSLANDSVTGGANGNYGGGSPLGNYALAATIDTIPSTVAHPATDFFGNLRPETSGDGFFDPGAVEFGGSALGAPTLTAINPSSGLQGSTVVVALTGTNLTAASSVNVGGGGITVSAFTDTSSTSITATFVIAATAAVGSHAVTVTTPGGTTAAVSFTVAARTLTAISPASGLRGTTVPVTITGNGGLTGATAVNVAGTGVTVSGVTVTSDTTITATFAISATAGLGNHAVTVTTPTGTVGGVNFSVTGPTVTSITPNPLLRSTAPTTVTISGADLLGATAVTVSGGGVSCTGASSSGTAAASTVTANCTSTATAATGARTVTVATPNGNATGSLTISGPTVTSIAPNSGAQGTAGLAVTITGTNLSGVVAGTGVTMSGTGVTCTLAAATSSTTVTATCSISGTATLSARNVTVTTTANGAGTLTGGFTVRANAFSAPSQSLLTGTTTAHSGTITFTNGGAAAFTPSAAPTVTKVGAAGGTFSVTGGTCASGTPVAASGGTCTVVVTYTPSGTTTATANVTLADPVNGTLTSANFTAN